MREIALQPFDQNTYIRHLAFNDIDELTKYIVSRVPRNLFYSSAIYEYPSAKSMDEKVWLGADIVFDIDSDHIRGCIVKEVWICEKLHYGEGDPGSTCPYCGSNIIVKTDLISRECLNLALDHVIKLCDILMEDFGISKNRIHVYFSGNRGFHIHVHTTSKEMRMSSDVRREIVDYIKGIGLDINTILLNVYMDKRRRKRIEILLPSTNDYGWRRRIAKSLQRLSMKRDIISIINSCITESIVEIDEKVTIDTRRLVRFPYSLHGKTGLMVTPIKLDEEFDIYKAIPSMFLKERIRIVPLINIDKLDILNIRLKMTTRKRISVDEYIGLYMALKGLAYIIR